MIADSNSFASGLNRDVLKRRSIVTLKWENDPEKRLGLPVPFDCPLDTLRAEAEKAVRAASSSRARFRSARHPTHI